MGGQPPRALTLDSGALIAVEQGRRAVEVAIRNALQKGAAVFVPVPQPSLRSGGAARARARLAQMLATRDVEVVPLDGVQARLVGVLGGRQKHDDVVDGSVASWRARASFSLATPITSGRSIPYCLSRRYEV